MGVVFRRFGPLYSVEFMKINAWFLGMFMLIFLGSCSDLDTSAYRRKRSQDSMVTREFAEKVTIEYTDSGRLRARIFSPILVAVKQKSHPYLEMRKGLKVDFYEQNGDIQSYLTAEYAISYPEENRVIVRNNVEILNVKGEMLNTEELKWDQKRGKIYTDRFVKITTPDQIITGQGLESNQSFTDWEILNVSGTINVPYDKIPRPRSVVPGRGRY
jgi:LPS export ABC transporter protein LptC